MCDNNRITLDDVVSIISSEGMVIHTNGRTFQCECPSCHDRRGKFYVTLGEGYYCHRASCGLKGKDPIKLFMEYFPSPDYEGDDGYKNAVKDIYASIGGDVSYQKQQWKEMTKQYDVERKSDDYCSKVYFSMIKLCYLRKEHKEDLLRRGLTEEQIRRFLFRSVPKDRYGLCRLLIKMGYDLEGVPGFYKDDKGNWTCFGVSGYLCPVFDGERNILLGFQVRVDNPRDGGKYIWFASKDKPGGASSGSIPTFLPGKNQRAIIVTEGILKATVIYSLLGGEVSVIGVAGIKSLKGLIPYFELYKDTSTLIFEAYDMEKCGHSDDAHTEEKYRSVEEWARKLQEKAEEYGINSRPLKWDLSPEGEWNGTYKGLDDFLLDYDRKDVFLWYLLDKMRKNQKMTEFLRAQQKEVES